MSLRDFLSTLSVRLFGGPEASFGLKDAPSSEAEDTKAAVKALARAAAAEDAQTAAEAALALAGLHRSHGDIDKAVRLRENLLRRNDIPRHLLAEAAFELGRDFRKVGLLDRALPAYSEAKRLGKSLEAVQAELLDLYADSGDFTSAARIAEELGNTRAESCFLVRSAADAAAKGEDVTAERLIRKALAVSPSSPEALRELTAMSIAAGTPAEAAKTFAQGMRNPAPSARLILLEGIYTVLTEGENAKSPFLPAFASAFAGEIDKLPPSLIPDYYAGLYSAAAGMTEEAEAWFTKAHVLNPDFWAARLALLENAAAKDSVSSLLAAQVKFFVEQGRRARRFICPPCGMQLDRVFSVCPRCRAWHSVMFRLHLN